MNVKLLSSVVLGQFTKQQHLLAYLPLLFGLPGRDCGSSSDMATDTSVIGRFRPIWSPLGLVRVEADLKASFSFRTDSLCSVLTSLVPIAAFVLLARYESNR